MKPIVVRIYYIWLDCSHVATHCSYVIPHHSPLMLPYWYANHPTSTQHDGSLCNIQHESEPNTIMLWYIVWCKPTLSRQMAIQSWHPSPTIHPIMGLPMVNWRPTIPTTKVSSQPLYGKFSQSSHVKNDSTYSLCRLCRQWCIDT